MDSINFIGKDNYPVSADTLDMMQNMTKLAASPAKLGGNNYIMDGCVENGVNVTPGTIVINGTPYVFLGGAKGDKITILETKPTLVEEGEEFPEAYTKRIAMFAENGEYEWGKFKRVLTNQELEEKFNSIKGTPLGIPEMWVGYLDKIPENYRLCNGDYLSQDAYPELYNVIGPLHGSNAPGNFALPDMRQLFVVGYDNRHEDYKAIGKGNGLEKVTLSESEMPEHIHKYTDDTNALGKFPSIEPGFPQSVGEINPTRSSAESSGAGTVYKTTKVGGNKPHENRPPFFIVAYIMKIKY